MATLLVLGGCNGDASGDTAQGPENGGTERTTITFRQFSPSPSLARAQGSPDPLAEDYGALSVFLEKVESRTAALGPGSAVSFSLEPGVPTLAEVADAVYEAGQVSGGSLNPVWGFLFNSIPFGPSFAEMVDFLYAGNGIDLANQALERRGVDVVALPVVGSPAQLSGYFRKPLGPADCPPGDAECASHGIGIGLAGLCAEQWTIRYLPPAETIIDTACDEFPNPQRLRFVQAIPGGSAFLTALQQGAVDGMEFATALDDYDAQKGGFFLNASAPAGSDGRNAGEIGLRYLHYPAWHQPFFLGWMLINKSMVWDRLDESQRAAIQEAAREALEESFAASSSLQCDHLERILATNDGRQQAGDPQRANLSADIILTPWPSADLERLRTTTRAVLENAKGGDAASEDQADYAAIVGSLQSHLRHESIEELLAGWSPSDLPVGIACN
jgi:TRAP-type mannitol/chloroaromatic compound transport system substrate-binding protein